MFFKLPSLSILGFLCGSPKTKKPEFTWIVCAKDFQKFESFRRHSATFLKGRMVRFNEHTENEVMRGYNYDCIGFVEIDDHSTHLPQEANYEWCNLVARTRVFNPRYVYIDVASGYNSSHD